MVLAVLMTQAIAATAAGERTELKAAFRAGKLELTLTAKNEGATLELKIENQTKDELLLVIPEGKTEFDVHRSKVALVASATKNVDQLPEGVVTLTFPMEQSGGGRWTSGSVTQSVTLPPSRSSDLPGVRAAQEPVGADEVRDGEMVRHSQLNWVLDGS